MKVTSSGKIFEIFNTGEHSVNREDLLASTLVGLTWENTEVDPLAVQHLDNRLHHIVKLGTRTNYCSKISFFVQSFPDFDFQVNLQFDIENI